MTIEDALKIIVARSPHAAGEAMRTLTAIRANSPVVQIRYNNTVERALADPDAKFTDEERAILAEYVQAGESPRDQRDTILHVRMRTVELDLLKNAALDAGLSVSDYVRGKLFGSGES